MDNTATAVQCAPADQQVVGPAEYVPEPPHEPTELPSETTPAPESASPAFVYAIGRVESRLPNLAVEKEVAQALGRGGSEGLTDRQALQTLISERANRYLARQLCWVFLIEGLETYILVPRDPVDLDLLIEAVRPQPRRDDVDVVIGLRGPIAPPAACNGLSVPIVAFDQLYFFDRDALIASVPAPDSVSGEREEPFRQAVGELFDRIMQIADNAGAIDEHRALNYLAVRYPAIYAMAAEAYGRNASLSGVDVRPSRLSGVRKIVDVVFHHTHRETDVTDMHFVRVDVSDEFPFLVTKLSPYYGRP